MSRSIDQERAKFAMDIIMEYKDKPIDWQGRYLSYVKGLPAMVLSCGFGQSVATLLSQASGEKDSPYIHLFNNIQCWLCEQEQGLYYGATGKLPLMTGITEGDMDTYLNAQAESLVLLAWLKKFAVAFLQQPEKGGDVT